MPAPPGEMDDLAGRLARCEAENAALAYAASHDLRQPLRAILHSLELLERRHAAELSPPARALLERALHATGDGHAMIEAMLEYSRVYSRAEPMQTVDLRDLVERVRRELRQKIESTGASIDCGELPAVVGDPRQLLALLRHLIDNALTFHGDAPPRVRIQAGRVADGWELAVIDRGIGMPPDAGERIFELFRTCRPPGQFPGIGAGLAICRRIAERHGGSLTADSPAEGGTVIRFRFPRLQPAVAAENQPRMRIRPAGGAGTA